MFVLTNSQTVFFDVDETLINWSWDRENYTTPLVTFDNFGVQQTCAVNKHTVSHLIDHKKNGKVIVIWSAAGYEHAYSVIKALELENYVDVIMGKPIFYYDDLKSSEFLSEAYRLDLDPITGINKNHNGLN